MANTKSLTASSQTATAHLNSIDLSGLRSDAKAAASRLQAPLHKLLSTASIGSGGAAKPGSGGGAKRASLASGNLDIKSGVEQAWLVGSQIVAFDRTVDSARRVAAVQSALLAQLTAQSHYPRPDTVEAARAWQSIYIQTLTHIGWVLQSGEVFKNSTGEVNVNIDKALIKLLEALLPGGAAIALAEKVISALEALDSSSPLITIFQERTVEQKSVDFSMALSTQNNAGFLVNIIEYALDAREHDEQILFFRWSSADASLNGRRYDLTLDDSLFASVQNIVESKIKDFSRSFISQIY